ncbi:MAG: sulfotransferase, partial [Gammaproteobacteria bacterium]|nr:sulfotransferase [Gammaproteobacteria bacterium]
VHGAGEVDFFNDLAATLPDRLEDARRYPLCVDALHPEEARSIVDEYLSLLRRDGANATRICDKMPLNFQHLGLIAALFPRARIIHCRRNPLDVCISIFAQHFARDLPFAYDLKEIAGYYLEYERLMRHWRQVLPGRLFEVEYENIVAETETVSRDLVAHCGLDWDERCLRFYETQRNVGTASHWQVRQPVYRDSLSRWKRYESHLEGLIDALGPAIAERS